jgi:hypothetical protein
MSDEKTSTKITKIKILKTENKTNKTCTKAVKAKYLLVQIKQQHNF